MKSPESPTAAALRPGDTVWCIGPRSGAPVKRIVVRVIRGAIVKVRASTFSREDTDANAEDVFTDRDACRAEIIRRREAQAKEAADG